MSEEEKQIFNKMIYCNLINGEQALKFNRKYKDLQQKVEQLEKENEYLKMSNPEQNMEHFRIVNENKRKIDMLRKENHQLENIRKEAREYIKKNLTIGSILDGKKTYCLNSYSFDYEDLLNILNKGE